MLLFLGDSCPLGYELEIELLEHTPQSFNLDHVYNTTVTKNGNALVRTENLNYRPDLAYPHLIATELNEPYWNLGMGGASYDFILQNFQTFLKEHEIPQDTTVFLSCVSFYRRLMYDSFNSRLYTYFPSVKHSNPPGFSVDAEELLTRTAPSHAVQQINHIYEMCKSRNWNFCFHGVGWSIEPSELDALDRLCEVPEENRLSELWKVSWAGVPDDQSAGWEKLWFGFHPSVKGHEHIAKDLSAWYRKI